VEAGRALHHRGLKRCSEASEAPALSDGVGEKDVVVLPLTVVEGQ
jgi:hypothetical protein